MILCHLIAIDCLTLHPKAQMEFNWFIAIRQLFPILTSFIIPSKFQNAFFSLFPFFVRSQVRKILTIQLWSYPSKRSTLYRNKFSQRRRKKSATNEEKKNSINVKKKKFRWNVHLILNYWLRFFCLWKLTLGSVYRLFDWFVVVVAFA